MLPIYTNLKLYLFLKSYQALSRVFFPCHWLLSYKSIVETMDSGKKGINPLAMNPLAMTIINPRKEYWPN